MALVMTKFRTFRLIRIKNVVLMIVIVNHNQKTKILPKNQKINLSLMMKVSLMTLKDQRTMKLENRKMLVKEKRNKHKVKQIQMKRRSLLKVKRMKVKKNSPLNKKNKIMMAKRTKQMNKWIPSNLKDNKKMM